MEYRKEIVGDTLRIHIPRRMKLGDFGYLWNHHGAADNYVRWAQEAGVLQIEVYVRGVYAWRIDLEEPRGISIHSVTETGPWEDGFDGEGE